MSDDNKRYVTKSKVTGRIFHLGDFTSCVLLAQEMNCNFQTDEYMTEEYDPEKSGFRVTVHIPYPSQLGEYKVVE